jgi:hypothetical protein
MAKTRIAETMFIGVSNLTRSAHVVARALRSNEHVCGERMHMLN